MIDSFDAQQFSAMYKPPFPWFGGKSRAAGLIWPRLGDVPNYIEPFAGSLAVLMLRPHAPQIETVNDKDAYLANFWRALQYDPDGLCRHADWPVNEADLHARHRWLLAQADFRERMSTDPDYYDIKIAGWWVWGLCQWIGSGWCAEPLYNGDGNQQLPHLGDVGMGVHRPWQKRPHLGGAGRGVHRPSSNDDLLEYFRTLATRLRCVRVCCGDWMRVLGESPTIELGMTAVLLDPPYSAEADRGDGLYGIDDDSIAHDVRAWAIANGDNPLLRIALCGYADEHDHEILDSWERVTWKTAGGYGSQGNGRGRDNAAREVIWFSPHCLRPDRYQQVDMFEPQGAQDV
jgi:hypothetical protein